jgi:hypothetical protein
MSATKKPLSYERPKLINLTSESWEATPVGQFQPAFGSCPDGQFAGSATPDCAGGSFVTGNPYCECGNIATYKTC